MKPEGVTPVGGALLPRGRELLANPLLNKGTAFSERERDVLGLRGLLPPKINTIEEQVMRAYANYRKQTSDLGKYTFLVSLQSRNETLFYRLLAANLEEMMGIIYTPTVGQACLEFAHIYRRPRGLYVSYKMRGRVAEALANWHVPDVRIIVVTDGERILGLGDLGALGMGIPIGKLSLYTACAGLHPYYTLPIMLDVGTENEGFRADPLYTGINQRRVRGAEYDAFVDEFVQAVKGRFPKALIQWEDFGNQNAFRLLQTYRDKVCSFNDDIQGTAAVSIAGVIAGLRLTGQKLTDQRLLFLGAGEAGTGIGDLFVAAARLEGMSEADARAHCWFVDSQGLVCKSREKLAHHKLPYAHDVPFVRTLAEAVEVFKPTVLVGVSTIPKSFTPAILKRMAELNKRPIIQALSNPTSKSECTAEECYTHTDGKGIFISGSPFKPFTYKGKTYHSGQGNNVYIFPGMGFGALVSESAKVTDEMFLRAAQALASMTSDEDLALGRVYPALSRIREVSAAIATSVAEEAYNTGLAGRPRPANVLADIKSRMFVPEYRDYI